MNSSFKLNDVYSYTSYDVGVPSFLGIPGPSKTAEETKIYFEPSLFARRVEPTTRKVSSTVERLPVERHFMSISAEKLSVTSLNDVDSDLKNHVTIEVDDKLTVGPPGKQRPKKVNKPPVVNPSVPSPATPPVEKRIKVLHPVTSQAAAVKTPSKPSDQETVVIQLSNGQFVRVPRSVLRSPNKGPILIAKNGESTSPKQIFLVSRTTSQQQTQQPVINLSNYSLSQALGRVVQGQVNGSPRTPPAPIRSPVLPAPASPAPQRIIKIMANPGVPGATVQLAKPPQPASVMKLSQQLQALNPIPKTILVQQHQGQPSSTVTVQSLIQPTATVTTSVGSSVAGSTLSKVLKNINESGRMLIVGSDGKLTTNGPSKMLILKSDPTTNQGAALISNIHGEKRRLSLSQEPTAKRQAVSEASNSNL